MLSGDLHFLHGNHQAICVASVDKKFDYYTLQLITGQVELHYGNSAFKLRGSWMWSSALGPRVRFHAWPRERPWDHRYIACTGPLAMRWHAQGLWPTTPQAVDKRELQGLRRCFDQMLLHAKRPGRWARLRAANLLEGILLQRAESRSAPPASESIWLQRALEALSDLATDIDYAQLADGLNMSLPTLRRRFRAATGQSLHAYRLELRIHEARRLLVETEDPIKHIADRLGYRDVFYFCRHFTGHLGVPPGAYRRSRQD